MQQSQEKQITVDGIEISYKIAGTGPAILILHGWGSRSDRWLKVAELLSHKNFSVVVPDLPGFGKSGAPSLAWSAEDYCNFIEQFVQKTGLQNFYLLGHSFGGGVAATYTVRFPQRVRGLFLVAPGIIRRKTMKKRILRFLSRVLKVFSFVPFYTLFRRAFYKYIVRKSDYLASGLMKQTYLKVIGNDLSQYLPDIHTPTLIIWGSKDDVLPVQDAYIIQDQLKNSELAIIPEADHDIEQHMPGVLAAHIVNFCYSKK